MSGTNQRILLNVTMQSRNDPDASQKADEIFYSLNSILSGRQQLPNLKTIFEQCNKEDTRLCVNIRNRCLNMINKAIVFNPTVTQSNSLLNNMDCSARKQIRIVLFPGDKQDIEGLDVHEATHNMIIQFDNNTTNFRPTEAHPLHPSFYQKCGSIKTALLYIEALMVDACLCHHLGISDVARFHDEKQKISSEKVQFLLDLCQNGDLSSFAQGTQDLLKSVVSKITVDTPYISFLSVFTVALQDFNLTDEFNYFEEYCHLWCRFQKWYFKKKKRYFKKGQDLNNSKDNVFGRSDLHGQISKTAFVAKLKEKIDTAAFSMSKNLFGIEHRYAIIVLRHMPKNPLHLTQLDSLFSGNLHQAKWDIVYWEELEKYASLFPYLDFFPIMIE